MTHAAEYTHTLPFNSDPSLEERENVKGEGAALAMDPFLQCLQFLFGFSAREHHCVETRGLTRTCRPRSSFPAPPFTEQTGGVCLLLLLSLHAGEWTDSNSAACFWIHGFVCCTLLLLPTEAVVLVISIQSFEPPPYLSSRQTASPIWNAGCATSRTFPTAVSTHTHPRILGSWETGPHAPTQSQLAHPQTHTNAFRLNISKYPTKHTANGTTLWD